MDNEWMAEGNCRTEAPSLFFPSDGVGVEVARRICANCPVKLPCLEYALANSIDHACAVRDRDQRQAELWVVVALHNEQVTVVKGCGPHPHAHLPWTGLWRRPFNKGEMVKPELAGNLEGTHGDTGPQQGSGCPIHSKR